MMNKGGVFRRAPNTKAFTILMLNSSQSKWLLKKQENRHMSSGMTILKRIGEIEWSKTDKRPSLSR